MDACCLFKRRQINSPWEVVKPFFSSFLGGCLVPFSPYLEELSMNTTISSSKEADILHMHIYFP